MPKRQSALLYIDGQAVDRDPVTGDVTADLIAWVRSGSNESLTRIQNISDDGMKLMLDFRVQLGDTIHVVLGDGRVIKGGVVWTTGACCGIMFSQPIDSAQIRRQISESSRHHTYRGPRIPLDGLTTNAMSVSGEGLLPVRVLDVSQTGMKLTHDGRFSPGLHVRVTTEFGVERCGIVRWSQDGVAGLLLDASFAIE